LINPKEEDPTYREEWKKACARCFNSTRTFNAMRATYAERIALLESLRGMHQDWEAALGRVIEAFRADWAGRTRGVAGVFAELLRECLRRNVTGNVYQPGEESSARAALVVSYQEAIKAVEARAHGEVKRLFKHNIFNPAISDQSILREDLFTEKTWQVLGLNRTQILVAAAALGAGAGVKLDLVLGQLTFGLFTISGAALGVAAAWLKGENMARARVKHLKLGGVQVTVGPNRNPQFPFVLLDRILLLYRETVHWAHARRDAPIPAEAGGEGKLGVTAGWSRERRQVCLRFIKLVLKGHRAKEEEAERALIEMLVEVLDEVSC
jgi:hypothetical protein